MMAPNEPTPQASAEPEPVAVTDDGDLAAAFRRAEQARNAIAGIIAAVRGGEADLVSAFARADADPLVGRCFAVKVFEAVPGVGKVRARRTMESLGLAEDLALGEVPASLRDDVVAAFVAEDDQDPRRPSG